MTFTAHNIENSIPTAPVILCGSDRIAVEKEAQAAANVTGMRVALYGSAGFDAMARPLTVIFPKLR